MDAFVMFDFSGFNFDKLPSYLHLYTGIFLDDSVRNQILQLCPPRHSRVFADHITLVFKPSFDEVMAMENWTDDHGDEVEFIVNYSVSDEHCQVLRVTLLAEGLPSKNDIPHITISCAEGTSPAYSNKLARSWIETT